MQLITRRSAVTRFLVGSGKWQFSDAPFLMIVSSYVPRRSSWKWPLRCLRYDKLRLVCFIVLYRSSIQLLFVLRSLSSWMWRRLLVHVCGIVTSLVAMHTGRHTPYAIGTTEVGLKVKLQVCYLACHGNQMAVAVVCVCFKTFSLALEPTQSSHQWLLSREQSDGDLKQTTQSV